MDDPPFTITGDVPEWLDVIHCGQVTPTHGGFKSAGEDKSAVPSCYESGDSTSLSGSDNTSEGGKELHVKDGYHGRYSFRSRDEVRGDDASCRITRMCVARHSSNRSTGFEPGVVVVETNEDELPEVFVTADSTQSFSGEIDAESDIGRAPAYASLPKELLRVPRSRKGRLVVSSSKKGGRHKGLGTTEVRRVPSDSADSGIYTSFGKDVRSYGLPEERTEMTDSDRSTPVPEKDGEQSSTVEAAAPLSAVAETDRRPPTAAELETERRLRQRKTELATIFMFVPVLIAWVLIVPLVLFSYSFENAYSKYFQLALWICIPLSTLVLCLTCLMSNVYWYYDEETRRWRYLLHCGKGPAGFYWGDVLSDAAGGDHKGATVHVV